MKSDLSRTGSGPINPSLLPGSPSFSDCRKLEVNNNRPRINRVISEPQAIIRIRSISSTFPKALPETKKCLDQMTWFPASGIAEAEVGVGGGSGRYRDGFGSGRPSGGRNNNNNDNEVNKIGSHYQKVLKMNRNDPLILRNYSKFLHQVKGDTGKAEEYCGRAILANPGDGELLSLYGKLIWDTQRDGEHARSYFDQAVLASPDDCMVMGSYVQFMWEADEHEDDEEESGSKVSVPASRAPVAAF